MNLTLNLIMCGVLVLLTVGVALYRKWLENHCDHYIHLHNDAHDATVVDAQSAMCKRLDMMDKLRTGLIAAVVVYALSIAGWATYSAWHNTGV